MTPTWTGKAGEPVPAMLRHRRATDPTRGAPDGRCACGLPLASGERARPTDLCPSAVAQRLSELEAHEASIHKAVGRARRGIVRWLRRDLDQLWERATNPRMTEHAQSFAIGAREALALASEGVAAGRDAEWCEANPEIPPAPVGADAGREPGREDPR